MPVVKEREYRQMFQPLMIPQGTTEKRFDTDFYVEGFATTFDKPYVMYEYGGIKYCEVIDRNALVGADLSDVIMQFDHSGMVFARNKMAKNKPPSLLLEPQDGGLRKRQSDFMRALTRGLFAKCRGRSPCQRTHITKTHTQEQS